MVVVPSEECGSAVLEPEDAYDVSNIINSAINLMSSLEGVPLSIDRLALGLVRVGPDKCEKCDSTGYIKCDLCDGDGACPHCEQDCPACDGSGRLVCEHCENGRTVPEYKALPVRFEADGGATYISGAYLEAFRLFAAEKRPNHVIKIYPDDAPQQPSVLACDDIFCIVMPVRVDNPERVAPGRCKFSKELTDAVWGTP